MDPDVGRMKRLAQQRTYNKLWSNENLDAGSTQSSLILILIPHLVQLGFSIVLSCPPLFVIQPFINVK